MDAAQTAETYPLNLTDNVTGGAPLDTTSGNIIFKMICVVSYIVIIIAAALGNILVCIAFFMSQALRKSPTNYFILSLAISDLLTATLCIPFDAEQTLTNWQWAHGRFLCSVWTTVYLFAVPSSVLSLLAVSVDRYKALSDPLNRFRQERFMTRKRACVVIAGLWMYSFVFALVPEMGWKMYQDNLMYGMCYFNITEHYSVISSFLNFVFPVLIMCALYFRIYQIAKKTRRAHRGGSDISNFSCNRNYARSRKRLNKNIKTTKNILIVVCTFVFCWVPFTTYSLVGIFCKPCYMSTPEEMSSIFLILGYSNSALNPYLYAFRNKKFKETYIKALRTLSVIRDHQFSSRRSYGHTTPTVLSDSICHARNVQLSTVSTARSQSSFQSS